MRRPATWTRDDGPATPLTLRAPAEPEPWEREDEPFDGATVLDDLEGLEGAAPAAGAVVARYAVLRLVMRAADIARTGAMYEERAAAASYLEAGHAMDPIERAALRTVLRQLSVPPQRGLAAALLSAGARAAASEYPMGAFALLRTAYLMALEGGWWWEASDAANAISRLAHDGGGRRSERRWRRRAAVLHRRAEREDAEEVAED